MRLAALTHMALVIASAVAGASCISGAEPIGRGGEAIIGGDADPGDTAVVALVDVSSGSLCSGTLVAPSLVLTAAHCVDGIAPSALQVLVGSDTSSPEETVAVASVASYPTYTSEESGIPGGVDLGVVTLANPLAIVPVSVDTTTTDAELSAANVTVVGYGVSDGTDDTGGGTRRAVALSVTEVCSRIILAGNAETNACVGDSGGAVFLGGRLVGVVSGGELGCHGPTTFMRTDAHADWISAVLSGDASAACPTCTAPDPSCGAATETKPEATAGDDAGANDAGAETTTSPCGGGGCQVARDGAGESTCLLALLAIVAALERRRRRETAPG